MNTVDEMDFEKFKIIINNLPENLKHIQFTGGEPLMSPHIVNMVDYLDKKNVAMTLISNLVNTNFLQQIVKYKSIILVNSSIDGTRESS